MELVVQNLEELQQEARTLLARLTPKEGRATLVTLSGELGAGKTALVQCLAKELGVSEDVTSPTFVLLKLYELQEGQAFKELVHIDAYRFEDPSELDALGLEELLSNPQTLICIEWPENVRGKLPEPDLALTLTLLEDGSRKLTYA